MATGIIDSSPAKETTEEVIECHLLPEIKLRKCPAEKCMWNNGAGGCLYRQAAEPEDLGRDKGMTDKEIVASIRKGKFEINKIIILDAYVNFLKERLEVRSKTLFASQIRNDATIDELLRTSKQYQILLNVFSMDNFIMCHLFDDKLYSEFCEKTKTKPINTVTLTGIREVYQERINKRIRTLIKTANGKKVKVKRKKSKSKNLKGTEK